MKAYFSAKLCRVASFQHLLPVQIVTSCHFFFLLVSTQLWPPQKGPFQPFLITRRDYQGLGLWHSQPPSASSGLRLRGTSHAFSLTFKVLPFKVLGKAVAAAVQPFPCPGPTSVLTLMQAAPRMHWDAGTWKLGLDVRRHWPWRHILTVQRGRTVWANPTLSQPLSSLFLFPDLNQCLFFFLLLSSMVSGSLLLSLFHPPPSAVPALHLLGTSDSTSWVCSERTLL